MSTSKFEGVFLLQKWEEHSQEERRLKGGEVTESAAMKALRSWASVSKKAREALRKASVEAVSELEHHFICFLDEVIACSQDVWYSLSGCDSGEPKQVAARKFIAFELSSDI